MVVRRGVCCRRYKIERAIHVRCATAIKGFRRSATVNDGGGQIDE